MTLNESRQQAIGLAKNYVVAISATTGKTMDFYRMLWVIHWSIETYGGKKTRDALENLILAPDFEPERAPEQLRDFILTQALDADAFSAWFKRAIADHQPRIK